ncbi:PEX11 family protein NDAI_0G01390 [Naumovozyma dairenensis CBS 421]|uniref:Peroxisomal membrane protein PEX11 n=1 Tax=Naumovozyma dairenensis (strain ATCC 10597 / BCRC 20456 / CBS 421 / NBRC 0211 / NRRL Y-12639) TaxID=1071378 RepID=G0WDQ4_NAUDC|nr:hypothetical protein NDAI_0G01390 [Naumovozyma dairenensis CBS 421]CCD25915.2 hypothetical protein NDAI_0G01390 [Naumovozyma dairenensis CBS 421]
MIIDYQKIDTITIRRKMVLDTLVYHPTITRLIKFFDTSSGREKILRLLQYLCRFLALQDDNLATSPKKRLELQFLLIRKVLRFLKPLNFIRAASKAYDNKLTSDSLVRYCKIWKNVAFALYLALDQINLLHMLNLIPLTRFVTQTIPHWTNLAWLLSLFIGIVLDTRKVQIAQTCIYHVKHRSEKDKQNELDGDEDKKVLASARRERSMATRKLLWDILDSLIVLKNLSYIKTNDGYISLAGITTSLMGLQDLWNGTI